MVLREPKAEEQCEENPEGLTADVLGRKVGGLVKPVADTKAGTEAVVKAVLGELGVTATEGTVTAQPPSPTATEGSTTARLRTQLLP